MFSTFKLGMLLGLSIIISIGAQNLFIIQQAMRNEYTYLCALLCFTCDVILIMLGVAGLSTVFLEVPTFKIIILLLGIIFLGWYGISALKRAWHGGVDIQTIRSTSVEGVSVNSLSKLVLLGLSFSLLNPQAILDTIVIIGGSANHYVDTAKYLFITGAITASLVWFMGLALFARYLSHRLMSQHLWRIVDAISGTIMMAVAANFSMQLI